MRLATYNVENLFTRAKALNLDSWAEGKPVLEAYAELSSLFEDQLYTEPAKTRMVELLAKLGIVKTNEGPYAMLRVNRGDLLKRSRVSGKMEITAKGRADWIGFLELKRDIINEIATRNSAQVVRDVDPDVLGVVECEGRDALLKFSRKLLPAVGGGPFDNAMLIDGNDERGIDVGLLSKRGYGIAWMKSHVDTRDEDGGLVFSRDCPEYGIWTPGGEMVWVLVNHYKSKGYGSQSGSDRRRHQQAVYTRANVERLRAEGASLIAVVGDLNDTPDSEPLAPLMRGAGLTDIGMHPAYVSDGRPGTYQRGTEREKIDYILLSDALYARVQQAGIWRRGVWGPNKKPTWDVYPEMTESHHAASDHAALWVDIAV
ncbi:MAG: endonuclease/exonuclease/phosphatase family protein [Hyphomicrobiaceae bacterium]|nr:endonuclease/exonuclease/phosphatase family protein [Hyphomicrobiaceae bacterium]